MFDVGFWELTFIMTLALLVLGPDKLPGLVRSLGRWMGRARSVARNLRVQIEREVAEMPDLSATAAKPKPSQTKAAAEPAEPAKPVEPANVTPPSDAAPTPAPEADKTHITATEQSSEPGTRF